MNLNDCPQEASVIAALANGSLPDELNRHGESCPICQDAQLVWAYLRDSARADAQTDLPSSGVIWWRAQLAKKRAAAQRSVAAIDVMQRIALAVTIIAVIAIAAWDAPKLIEVQPMLLAGAGSALLVFIASIIVVLTSGRHDDRRTSPRGM